MANVYESDQLLSEYLLMHYGSEEEIMPWKFGPKEAIGFPARTVAYFPEENCDRTLDLGCAVGRSSFELSRSSTEVIGIDFSQSFIDAAETLRSSGKHDYQILETGKQSRPATATLPDGAIPERVRFLQGDAMNLPDSLGSFDRVHAANLICRLPEPQKLLQRLGSLVRPGGTLVLATPCTWLDEFTPPANQPQSDTFSWLKDELAEHFELCSQHDEPFLIRETARKFQWTVSLVSVWKRKA
ncbi:putative 4-mercaptohistidine N1-methyltransferase [Verrucomicrobiaceae bacterium R5-34]|nr:putative 4-mercaptohistidine N1-methyltransferase [Verrucomicrobiaceae bacterium R5-34]